MKKNAVLELRALKRAFRLLVNIVSAERFGTTNIQYIFFFITISLVIIQFFILRFSTSL